MRLCMTVADATLHFDLTGTDPQVPAAYNVPTMGTLHNWLTRRITTFIRTHDDTIPLNAGMYRPITATNPPGTVLNAEFPDPVAARHAAATGFNNAVTGALLKAAPDLMAGPTCGLGGSIVLTEPAPEGENASVIIVQSLRGGMSAYKGGDGVDGRDVTMNTMHNHPIETIEGKCALRVVEYDIATDSGGPGRWRGGVGQTMTLEVLGEGCTIQVRGFDRLRFPCWGVMGGRHGASPMFLLNRGKADERQLGKAEQLAVSTGDTITATMEGAAGYGDPFLRDPDAVRRDVLVGFVSRAGAQRDYGVVIADDDTVNEAATAAARGTRVKKNVGADFDFGPEREAWERVFDDATMSDLNRRLYALPKSVCAICHTPARHRARGAEPSQGGAGLARGRAFGCRRGARASPGSHSRRTRRSDRRGVCPAGRRNRKKGAVPEDGSAPASGGRPIGRSGTRAYFTLWMAWASTNWSLRSSMVRSARDAQLFASQCSMMLA